MTCPLGVPLPLSLPHCLTAHPFSRLPHHHLMPPSACVSSGCHSSAKPLCQSRSLKRSGCHYLERDTILAACGNSGEGELHHLNSIFGEWKRGDVCLLCGGRRRWLQVICRGEMHVLHIFWGLEGGTLCPLHIIFWDVGGGFCFLCQLWVMGEDNGISKL